MLFFRSQNFGYFPIFGVTPGKQVFFGPLILLMVKKSGRKTSWYGKYPMIIGLVMDHIYVYAYIYICINIYIHISQLVS